MANRVQSWPPPPALASLGVPHVVLTLVEDREEAIECGELDADPIQEDDPRHPLRREILRLRGALLRLRGVIPTGAGVAHRLIIRALEEGAP